MDRVADFESVGWGFESLRARSSGQAAMEILIRTDRLYLKKLEMADVPAVFAYRSDVAVSRYQSFRPQTLNEVQAFISANTVRPDVDGSWFQLGIHLHSGELIGDFGIHFLESLQGSCEIGYTVRPEYQRRGLGSEAARGVIRFLFETMGKREIRASIDDGNSASRKMIEGLGFRRTATDGENASLYILSPQQFGQREKRVGYLNPEDQAAILKLAAQVEDLFGKMVGVAEFEQALADCLQLRQVIGCKQGDELLGAGIVDREKNEIAWFVVDFGQRGKGVGARILERLLGELDERREITVQTFAAEVAQGRAARALYRKFGFVDKTDGGLNPAGIPTVIMARAVGSSAG